ncbi:hypothetical protein [Scytonema sp. NUACC26]|uniref:hypothetical protein n=1 Tax=Scytonema sp. NUACC26 TaxID=3140176 RepID=UPI0038B2D732
MSLIKEFYEPALNCAVRSDRSTGFFSARILTLAALGIRRFNPQSRSYAISHRLRKRSPQQLSKQA